MEKVATSTNLVLDRLAMGMSLLCAVHCLLLPIVLIAVPALSASVVGDEAFHRLLLIGVLPTSIISLAMGCRKHRHWRVASLGTIGLCVLVAAAFFGHNLLGESGEKLATLAGAALIVAAHVQNVRFCQRRPCGVCDTPDRSSPQ